MKTYRIFFITVVSVVIILFSYVIFFRDDFHDSIKNKKCYSILKSNYISDRGVENFSGIIIFSFLDGHGSITTRAELTTIDNKITSLLQQVNFNYDSSGNEYTIHVTDMIDDDAKNKIPKEVTGYMSNVLNIYFSNPKKLVFWIYPIHNDDYILYNEAIPWLYCNKLEK